MDDYLNKVLDNRYEILGAIGTGGMAIVYKARDNKLNRLVAVKVLKEELRSDEDLRRRFHTESEAMAKLNQNNIVKVFDVSTTPEQEYFVMEIVDGITLKSYIKQRGVLSIKEALHFTLQILKALEHAHSKKIVHRDIKPQNIMILRDGTVKVMDFGIARVMENQELCNQTQGAAFGSVHYIAPEQARGEAIDGRADIYSVGIILYEMLTGKLPFTGDSPLSIAMQHINSVPELPGKLNPEIPESLEIITMKAMCGDLEKRYASATEMINEIEAFRKDPAGFVPKGDYVHTDTGDTIKFRPYSATVPKNTGGASDSPRRERKKVNLLPIISAMLVLLVLAAVAITLWITILSPEAGAEDVQVPNLLGRTYDEVMADDTLDFSFEIADKEYNASYAVDEIIAQDKTAGSTVKAGSKIALTLSLGPHTLTMPNYTDYLYTDANTDLKNRMEKTVTIQFEFINSASVEKNHIVSTNPVAGDTIVEGQIVTFYVSLGLDVENVQVPQLTGNSLAHAKEVLYAYGLTLVDIEYVESANDTPGTVIWQSSPANYYVPKGTSINLKVVAAATTAVTSETTATTTEDNQWTYAPEDTSTALLTVELPTESRYPDKFYFEVYADGVPVYSQTLQKGDDALTLQISGHGTIYIEIYVDSVLWKSEYLKVTE